MVAVDIAPPAHMVISAVLASAPLQLVQRGGDQPGAGAADRVAERDRAAVDVDPVRVGLVHAQPGQHHRRERLVDLEQVDVADRHAAAVEHPLRWPRPGRPGGSTARRRPGLGDDPGPRPQAERPRPVRVHQQHGGGAVGDLRRRARGVQAAVEHRLQPGQRLQAGLAQALVAVDGAGLAGRLPVASSTGALTGMISRSNRPSAQACWASCLRAQAERVDVGAGDAAALGDPLGGVELVRQVDVPRRGPGRARVRLAVVAAAAPGSSPRPRRRCRRRWRRPRSARRSGGRPAAPSRTGRRG